MFNEDWYDRYTVRSGMIGSLVFPKKLKSLNFGLIEVRYHLCLALLGEIEE